MKVRGISLDAQQPIFDAVQGREQLVGKHYVIIKRPERQDECDCTVDWATMAGALLLFLGFALNQLWITLPGVLSAFLAMIQLATSSECLRRDWW